MKKSKKIALSVSAALLVGAGIATPAIVSAWGNNGGERESYTTDQINEGILGDKIVLNSISNSVIGDEKNFVGAREDTGINEGAKNVWDGNEINVTPGKTYLVRLYVHNNNPNGENAVAKDVTTTFAVPDTTGTSVEVNGFIESSNATPSEYWDYVRFVSSSNFHLEYVKGSALLENNGIGANGGIKLSDDIIEKGVKIGYDSLNGEVPGCYKYANYVTIKVKVVADDSYLVEKQVRKAGTTEWKESVDAEIGEKVEYRIHYKNTSDNATTNVMVKDVLPSNMKYVAGTTVLYNATNPKGIARDDTIITTGVNIGGYAVNGDGYVVFTAEVTDDSLTCGANTLTNWGQVGVGETTLQDSAVVNVAKTCNLTPIPSDDPTVIVETGASEIVTGAVGVGSVVTALGYYIASRKKL
jgi:uncharacterized repeat protein (TIGR01451 family)